MAPSKLSNADKQDIIERYKQPGETTSTLADRYGVSNSTISRLLKSSLP
ncbi:MAG: helix-turn-helix domain-containing protein, partial [Cyanobacteria bacterium P01_C01_bin.73]